MICFFFFVFFCFCFFHFGRIRYLVAMATSIFHRLIMGKVKIDTFFRLNGDIWNLFLQKCLLSSPLPFICFLSKSPNLIGMVAMAFFHCCGYTGAIVR